MEYRDETGAMLQASAQAFLAREFKSERLRNVYTGQSAYDRSFWRALADQGWLALRLPEALGGSGLDARHVNILAREFGRLAVPEPFVACSLIPAVLAAGLARSEAWNAITEGLADGRYVVTLAWQEHPQQFEAAPRATVARAGPDGYVLTGKKYGIVAAQWADALLVSCELDEDTALFLVPRDTAGLTFQHRLTSDGGTLAVADLQQVRLPREALLARGDACLVALAGARDEATLAVAAQLTGMTSGALDITLEYMRTRVQFGRRIGSFQSLQHMAVDVRVQLSLSQAACWMAERQHTVRSDSHAARRAIAAAKARASDTALAVARFGVQAHGAIGFASEAQIGLYLKGAIRLAAYMGSSSQQRRRHGEMAESELEHAA